MTLRILNIPVGGRTSVNVPLPSGGRLISSFVSAGTANWRVYDASNNVVLYGTNSRGTTLAGESWQFSEGMYVQASSISNGNSFIQITYDDRDVVKA